METRYFPSLFWPAVGDQVWMVGRWVFDCGHPPYRTEIHPPKAVAFTRFEPTIIPGETYPAWTNRTYVYVHGQGGYYQSPVTGPGYEFDIPLPAKPFSNTRERYNELKLEILDLPFGGPKRFLPLDLLMTQRWYMSVFPLILILRTSVSNLERCSPSAGRKGFSTSIQTHSLR